MMKTDEAGVVADKARNNMPSMPRQRGNGCGVGGNFAGVGLNALLRSLRRIFGRIDGRKFGEWPHRRIDHRQRLDQFAARLDT